METIPASICETTGVPLDAATGWKLDIDRVVDALQPNSNALIINFPHNPTGALLEEQELRRIVAICAERGMWLFSDEAYRPLGPIGGRQLPQVADLYDRGISLGVMSKALGLPGLRVGWVACADRALLARIAGFKHYLSICNAAPSDYLARIALGARAHILARNRNIVSTNLSLWRAFFAGYPHLFEWVPPIAGCVSYPRYLGDEGVEAFAKGLVHEAGVLVLPASIYRSDLCDLPGDHFRIGAGRLGLAEGIAAIENWLAARRMVSLARR